MNNYSWLDNLTPYANCTGAVMTATKLFSGMELMVSIWVYVLLACTLIEFFLEWKSKGWVSILWKELGKQGREPNQKWLGIQQALSFPLLIIRLTAILNLAWTVFFQITLA